LSSSSSSFSSSSSSHHHQQEKREKGDSALQKLMATLTAISASASSSHPPWRTRASITASTSGNLVPLRALFSILRSEGEGERRFYHPSITYPTNKIWLHSSLLRTSYSKRKEVKRREEKRRKEKRSEVKKSIYPSLSIYLYLFLNSWPCLIGCRSKSI